MKYDKKKNGGLVYSTDRGRICPQCNMFHDLCKCRKPEQKAVGDDIIRLSRETKGRKGSGVTLVNGLSLNQDELKKMAGRLKKKCGSGGAVKNGIIEIQGDHRQLLIAELEKDGYKVKLAGG